MIADPVEQRPLKAYVLTCFLRLKPFVTHDFLTFRQKLLVQAGTLYEFLTVVAVIFHTLPLDQRFIKYTSIIGFVNIKLSTLNTGAVIS